MKAVFDSVILIDQLNSNPDATNTINQYEGYISGVTVTEILAGAESGEEEEILMDFLSNFKIIHTNEDICRKAAHLRRQKMRMPDALIYATAKHLDCVLITRNTRDFSDAWGDVKIPYKA